MQETDLFLIKVTSVHAPVTIEVVVHHDIVHQIEEQLDLLVDEEKIEAFSSSPIDLHTQEDFDTLLGGWILTQDDDDIERQEVSQVH